MTYPSSENFGNTAGIGKGVCVGVEVGEGGDVKVIVGLGRKVKPLSVGKGGNIAVAEGAVSVGNATGITLVCQVLTAVL
jgi:hypothetical protein